MKKTLLLLGLLVPAFASMAQKPKFGIIAGPNYANITYKENGSGPTTATGVFGFHMGIFLDIAFGENFSLQPTALYSTKGAKEELNSVSTSGGTTTSTHSKRNLGLNYYEFPINLLYYIPVNDNRIFLGGGPYIGVGVSGKDSYEISQTQIGGSTIASYSVSADGAVTYGSGQSDVKNPDYGINTMAGIRFKSGLILGAGYQLGIANLSNVSGNSTRNSVLSLSLGYAFK